MTSLLLRRLHAVQQLRHRSLVRCVLLRELRMGLRLQLQLLRVQRRAQLLLRMLLPLLSLILQLLWPTTRLRLLRLLCRLAPLLRAP